MTQSTMNTPDPDAEQHQCGQTAPRDAVAALTVFLTTLAAMLNNMAEQSRMHSEYVASFLDGFNSATADHEPEDGR